MTPAVLVAAIAASALTTAWHELQRRLERQRIAEGRCPGHRFVYHSLEYAGRYWNRRCSLCLRHETHWPGEGGAPANWPPPGAALARDEMPVDIARRPKPLT